jgi:hypothetical protein
VPDLSFRIEAVEAPRYAAAPLLVFRLRVANADSEEAIQTIVLHTQIRIEATRRRYDAREQERLVDLFGEPERWSKTLQSLLWAHVDVTIPRFSRETVVELPVPCVYDFNLAATKYFYAAENEEIPLLFLFSGTIFYQFPDGGLQAGQVSWEKEAPFRLPAHVWKQMMDCYYPNGAWLRIDRATFDRLYDYKRRQGFPTWEQALQRLLPVEEGAGA